MDAEYWLLTDEIFGSTLRVPMKSSKRIAPDRNLSKGHIVRNGSETHARAKPIHFGRSDSMHHSVDIGRRQPSGRRPIQLIQSEQIVGPGIRGE